MMPSEPTPRTTDRILAEARALPPVTIRRSWSAELAIASALVFRVIPVVAMGLCSYFRNDTAPVFLFPIATALLVAGELSRPP